MDSPRGRIQLMEKTLDGTLRLEPDRRRALRPLPRLHGLRLELPLGRPVRPADRGDAARRRDGDDAPRGERLQRRLLFATLPHPRRMRWALRLAPLGRALPSPRWARPMLELAPRWRSSERPPALTRRSRRCADAPGASACSPAASSRCVFGDVNAATARVLAAAGYEVVAPRQGCCGALSAHAGRADESARLHASACARASPDVDTIVVNASGCGSHLKDHGCPALDVTEALATLRSSPTLHPLELTVAYQDSCHLRHAQRLPAAWRPLLERIPGLRSSSPPSRTSAAARPGSTTSRSRTPRASSATARRRTCSRPAPTPTRARTPGCLVQVAQALGRAGRPLPALHPVELLDASIRGVAAARRSSRAPAADVRSRRRRGRAQLVEPVDVREARGRAASTRARRRSSATPPITTAGTAPTSAAATPDSNAPSSFEALMKTISTALTRPRSSSGVTSGRIVCREHDAHHVDARRRPRARASDSHIVSREPEDDHRHAVERDDGQQRPARPPPDGPARQDDRSARARRRPAPPAARRARRGRRRARPARRPAAARRRRRTARRTGRARSRRAAPVCAGRAGRRRARSRGRASRPPAPSRPERSASTAASATTESTADDRVDELRLEREQQAAERRPARSQRPGRRPTAARSARTRISRGTSDGVSARPAGAPSAVATPVQNASAKNGHVSSAPDARHREQPDRDRRVEADREREHRPPRDTGRRGDRPAARAAAAAGTSRARRARGRAGRRGSRRPASRSRRTTSRSRTPSRRSRRRRARSRGAGAVSSRGRDLDGSSRAVRRLPARRRPRPGRGGTRPRAAGCASRSSRAR